MKMVCKKCKQPYQDDASGEEFESGLCYQCFEESFQLVTYTLPFAPPVGKELHCLGTAEWKADCMKWRGRVLTGKESHWCYGWDDLPVDETTPEWPCECAILRA